MTSQLKLRAQSVDDIAVFSAVLQDAIFKVEDIHWNSSNKRLTAVCNRYCWEAKKRWFKRRPERVRCAFHFSGVLKAERMGITTKNNPEVLNLLALEAKLQDGESAEIVLTFSGGPSIRLHVECIEGVLSDVSKSWDALSEPKHVLS